MDVRAPQDFEGAFTSLGRARVGALITMSDGMFHNQRVRIVELTSRTRLPAMFPEKEFAEAGGLVGYGPSVPATFRRAATCVDRILKGAKPAALPVEQPTKFELVINLTAARALGLTIPPSLLVRVDGIIP